MSGWTPKYSDNERKAIERAGVELRIRPLRLIVAMADAAPMPRVPSYGTG